MNEELLIVVTRISPWLTAGVFVALFVWESLAPFFGFYRKDLRKRFVHGLVNLLLWAFNAALTIAILSQISELATGRLRFGLLHWINAPAWVETLCVVLVLDMWMYWWHRMNHRVPFFWRFHRVHHSDPFMDVTSASRFHFGEIIMAVMLRIPVLLLVGADVWHLVFYEVIMFPVVQFHHANIAVPATIDRALRMFIATPYMHKVHHSRYRPETDSNYSPFLSLWDRLFGSFRLKDDYRDINFGLKGFDIADRQSLWGLIKTPSLTTSHAKQSASGHG